MLAVVDFDAWMDGWMDGCSLSTTSMNIQSTVGLMLSSACSRGFQLSSRVLDSVLIHFIGSWAWSRYVSTALRSPLRALEYLSLICNFTMFDLAQSHGGLVID